jgi:GRASP55/65 PDZ-like domain
MLLQGQRTHTLTLPIPNPYPSSGLGLGLQYAPLSITSQIYHILTIPSPLSPAYLAGLLPHSDYILGSPSGLLHGESGLGELVEDYLGRELKLWVYNSEFDVIREVEITPRRGWGGEGALGAVLGFGALHRLPVPIGEEVQAPGEVVFDHSPPGSSDGLITQQQSTGDFLIPANVILSPPPQSQPQAAPPPLVPPTLTPPVAPPPTGGPRHKGRRPHHHHGATSPNAFDQYFAESEKKSKDEDFVPSRKGTPSAPPPKIGAGPPPLVVESPTPAEEEAAT